MKKYNCGPCQFTTLNLYNFNVHNSSKKHIINEENANINLKNKKHKCINCGTEFAFGSGLSKHKKICLVKNNQNELVKINADLQNQIQQLKIEKLESELKHRDEKLKLELKHKDDELKHSNEKLKLELEHKDERLKHKDEKLELKDELIKQKDSENKRMENVVKQSGSITKTTTKALAYLATKYPNAPTLQSFPKIDHDKIRGEFNSIPEMIYYTENHKTTVQHLSKVIMDHFLLEDHSKRPIWTSDSSRLKFIHCTIVEKLKQWIYDENGKIFGKEVLDSIIDKIRSELQQYIKDAPKKMKKTPLPKDMEMITLIQKAANRAVIKIDDGFIKNGVIRNIAPTFSLKIGHIVDAIDVEEKDE